jgi:hypothetical protein
MEIMNIRTLLSLFAATWLAALPVSTHYSLGSYGFGTGGTAGTNSGHYSINGIAGDTAGTSSSAHYQAGAGANYQQQADVPLVTLSNPSQWYNKLIVTLTPNGNPTDAKYVIAISTDSFATTYYVKSDLTLTTTFSATLFRTYTAWGGSSGFILRGLKPNSIYTAKSAGYRGVYTQSAYGPTSAGTTTNTPNLSFEIDIASTDTTSSPPYVVQFTQLLAGFVYTPPVRVWVSLDTNADSGGLVYVSDQNTGLVSSHVGYTINSTSTDINTQPEGYGAQGASVTQVSGGPLVLSAPFNGAGGNVGGLTTTFQQIFGSTTPITSGRGSFNLKAKSSTGTPASADYSDIMTVVAAASF